MEKELTTTVQAPALADSLIVVQQLPIIKEQLHSIKAQAQESVSEALSLACTEETLKVVKERRAALNRDRKDLDARRMAVKKQIIHDLRHSHVSLLIEMGFSALAIADRVGHESVDITYKYAHLFPSKQQEMAQKLDMERREG